MSDAPRIPLHLPEDSSGQVFQAPWEARAFAMVVDMSRRGLFEWNEFRQLLLEEIGKADAGPEPASGSSSSYYKHWIRAAERLMATKGLASEAQLAQSKKTLADTMEAERMSGHRHD